MGSPRQMTRRTPTWLAGTLSNHGEWGVFTEDAPITWQDCAVECVMLESRRGLYVSTRLHAGKVGHDQVQYIETRGDMPNSSQCQQVFSPMM